MKNMMHNALLTGVASFLFFGFGFVSLVGAQEEVVVDEVVVEEEVVCEGESAEIQLDGTVSFNGEIYEIDGKTIGELVADEDGVLASLGIIFFKSTNGGPYAYNMHLISDSDGVFALETIHVLGTLEVLGGSIELINLYGGESNTPLQFLEEGDSVTTDDGSKLVFNFDLSNDAPVSFDDNRSTSIDAVTFTVNPDGPACGCTDEEADNYDEHAEEDDESCLYTKPLTPVVECVYPESDGSYTAYFGYDNESNYEVTVPHGGDNKMKPNGVYGTPQPTVFPADTAVNSYPDSAFSVNFGDEEHATWKLTGPDGETRRAKAEWNEDTVVCEVACGDGRVNTMDSIEDERSLEYINEQCDDGNLENGDGCSDTCQIEDITTVRMPMCADGSVYARIVTDFDGIMMVGPYAAVTDAWFVVYADGSFVEYINDNADETDGVFVTQTTDGVMTVRHYGETATEVTTFDGTVEFFNAVDVSAMPEVGDFKFENGSYVDELSVEDTAVDMLMYVRQGSDGAKIEYTAGNEETLDCPAEPLPPVVVECRDGSVYGVIDTDSDVMLIVGEYSVMPGQPFPLFDGENYVVYDADIDEEALVVEQDEEGNLTLVLYKAEEDAPQRFEGTLSFIHGGATDYSPEAKGYVLEENDVVVLDSEGDVTFDLRTTTGNDGVTVDYQDENGITVCEGDVLPVMCDDVIYGTVRYDGFVRSFVVSEGFENDIMKINPVGEMVMNVTAKKGLGEVEFEIEMTNAYPTEYDAKVGGNGLESEENGHAHTDVVTLEESTVGFVGETGSKKDQFSVTYAKDPRCVSTTPLEGEYYPVCGDGTVYARFVSNESELRHATPISVGEYAVYPGQWFPVSHGFGDMYDDLDTPSRRGGLYVPYESDATYGLVITQSTYNQLEVVLYNDEVTNDRLYANGHIEFSNGYATAVTPMEERSKKLESNDSATLEDGEAVLDLRVTTGDDGVVVDYVGDQLSCLEALVCDGTQYGILRYGERVRPTVETRSMPLFFGGTYAIFDLATGYDDGRIVVTQDEAGDVVFTLNADAGRIHGSLELVNLDVTDLSYLLGGDGLEFGNRYRHKDEVDYTTDTMYFNFYTSSGIDVVTIETSTEGVCVDTMDECPNGDLSGSSIDGTCENQTICFDSLNDVNVYVRAWNQGDEQITEFEGLVLADLLIGGASSDALESQGIQLRKISDQTYTLTILNDRQLGGFISLGDGSISIDENLLFTSSDGFEEGTIDKIRQLESQSFNFNADTLLEGDLLDVITFTIETNICEDECEGEDLSGSTTDGECDAPVTTTTPSGGRSSSIGGGSTPSALLETGPEGDESSTEEDPEVSIQELVAQVDEDTIPACNEDTYIRERYDALTKQDSPIVQEVPSAYLAQIGLGILRAVETYISSLEALGDEKNAVIMDLVCQIELFKEANNTRYENIGAPARGSATNYLLQLIQDLAILEYDVEAAAEQNGDVVIEEEESNAESQMPNATSGEEEETTEGEEETQDTEEENMETTEEEESNVESQEPNATSEEEEEEQTEEETEEEAGNGVSSIE